MLTLGSIMLVLHLWRKWSAIILLSSLHLFWMQRSAYIWPSENEQASHCIGTFLRNDLLQLVQRLYVLSRMPNYCWSALKKWGNVRFAFSFFLIFFLWRFTWRKNFSRSLNKSLSWRPWAPNDVDINLLLANPKRRHTSGKSTIGLRGLMNLGSTCFMNCIVQVNSFICNVLMCCVKSYIFPGFDTYALVAWLFFCWETRMQFENVEQMSGLWNVSCVPSKSYFFIRKLAISNAHEFLLGILFWNSWTIITASTVTFNLDSRSSFSWIWATGCTWIFYSHTRRVASTLQECQVRGGKNRTQ